MNNISAVIKTDFIKDFKSLLEEKRILEEKIDSLKNIIAGVIEIFPDGIMVQSADELPNLFSQYYRFMPSQQCAALLHPEILSMVCDTNDTILAVSSNLEQLLGYRREELLNEYKGKLWAERPDKTEGTQLSRAAYLIYEVKQKHYHGTHEDAFITSNGSVISILQHRIDLKLPGGSITGYLYLTLNIQLSKATDFALAEVMKSIETELLRETSIELTAEMRRYLVKDLIRTREYIRKCARQCHRRHPGNKPCRPHHRFQCIV